MIHLPTIIVNCNMCPRSHSLTGWLHIGEVVAELNRLQWVVLAREPEQPNGTPDTYCPECAEKRKSKR